MQVVSPSLALLSILVAHAGTTVHVTAVWSLRVMNNTWYLVTYRAMLRVSYIIMLGQTVIRSGRHKSGVKVLHLRPSEVPRSIIPGHELASKVALAPLAENQSSGRDRGERVNISGDHDPLKDADESRQSEISTTIRPPMYPIQGQTGPSFHRRYYQRSLNHRYRHCRRYS